MSRQTLGPGDLLVRIGAVVFLIGAMGTLATLTPLLLGTRPLPTPAYFVSMLMGVGLALALGGLLRAALAQGRSVAAAGSVVVTTPGSGVVREPVPGSGSGQMAAPESSGQAAAEV